MKTYWLQTGRNKKLTTHISYKCKVKYSISMRFVSKIKIQLLQEGTTKKAILLQLFQPNFS